MMWQLPVNSSISAKLTMAMCGMKVPAMKCLKCTFDSENEVTSQLAAILLGIHCVLGLRVVRLVVFVGLIVV